MKILEKILVKVLFFIYKKKSKTLDSFPKKPKKIIVVSNTALGDTILSTPAIKGLKDIFSDVKIIAILNPLYVKLLDNVDFIDEIYPYKSGYNGFFKTLFYINKQKADALFIFHSNAPSDIELGVLSNIPYIFKHKTKHEYKKYLSFSTPLESMHAIENRLFLLKYLNSENKIFDKRMSINNLYNINIKNKIDLTVNYEKLIIFQMGSQNKHTKWPVEYFNKLARLILEHDKNIVIALTGTKNEKILFDNIDKNPRIVNFFGSFKIEELPYFINKGKIVITNDTGILHLAIAIGIPTISLFGASSSLETGPYQDLEKHFIIQKNYNYDQNIKRKNLDDYQMRKISVEEVFEIYKKAIN